MKLKLGILDQTPVAVGSNALSALNNSISLALWAEEAGFHSVMYSEHHGVEAYGSSSPELLAAIVLSKTKHIKVGTAGIMMRNYSAYKIAEWTKMLGSLYPGRFILGLGKAPGGLKDAVMALNSHRLTVLSNQENKLEEIIQFIKEEKGVYEQLIAQPKDVQDLPEILWLGSGMISASEAAKHGIGYSFAAFMNSDSGTENTTSYLHEFDDTQYGSEPALQIAVAVSVADDLQQARRNAYGMAYQFLQSRQLMNPDPLFPPEIVAQKISGSKNEEEFFAILDRIITETPETINKRLQQIAAKYRTNDVLILCNMYREEDRINTYKSIIRGNQ